MIRFLDASRPFFRSSLVLVFVSALLITVGAQEPDPDRGPDVDAAARGDGARREEPLQDLRLPEAFAPALDWRSIGPANMGGRITAIAVSAKDRSTYWVATASGGLLKTTDGGFSFVHQFEKQATVSIGDVAVAASNPEIVWVGTGEANPRNSVSWGDGVYKSVDGGKTWTNMGLRQSFQIGRIVIHPDDPNVVYVGALGRLWGDNEERGLYKTIDGGKTWEKILHVDDATGVVDLQMQPGNPDTLLVATWGRRRDGFDSNDPAVKYGPGSAIWKTTDGGKSFRKISQGLPSGKLGRVGIDWFRSKPEVVFMLVDTEKIGMEPEDAGYFGVVGENAEVGARITEIVEGGPAEAAGLAVGDIIVKVGEKTVLAYDDMIREIRKLRAGDKVAIEVSRERRSVAVQVELSKRPAQREGRGNRRAGGAGGAGEEDDVNPDARHPFGAQLGGQLPDVQDQQGPQGFEYGGVYRSDDAGETWTRINSLNPRPMYFSQIRVDPNDDKWLWVLGIQVHSSNDGGAHFTTDRGRETHADGHALWIDPQDSRHMLYGCDGGLYESRDRGQSFDHLNHMAIGQFYHVDVDSRRDYRLYGGLQDNGSWGGPARSADQRGPINEDWVRIGGGDGFVCRVDPKDPDLIYFESQNGGTGRRHLANGEGGTIRPRADRRTRYRFNWNTPFVLSAHNSKIYYVAGNRVFRSLDRGSALRVTSPELGMTERGTATSLSESPVDPDLVWVGTDDGALWVTTDGGRDWKNLAVAPAAATPATEPAASGPKVESGPGADEGARPLHECLPGPRWVSAIVSSRYRRERCYVSFDGHRSNDEVTPYLFMSEDAGATWRSLTAGLPAGAGAVRTVAEDIVKENMLWLGTEFQAFLSLDRGRTWNRINGDLPTVAVHGFAQSPACNDVIAATHGRSLWVLDATTLRQIDAESLAAESWLYQPQDVTIWRRQPARGGDLRRFTGENPPDGLTIDYRLGEGAREVALEIRSLDGQVLRSLEVETGAGFHRLRWDLRLRGREAGGPRGGAPRAGAQRPGGAGGQAGPGGAAGRGGRQGGGGPGRFGGGRVSPDGYLVVLTVDGKSSQRRFKVLLDPSSSDPTYIAAEDEEDEREEEEEAREHGEIEVIY